MNPTRVFVVDDHALFRDGMRALLMAQDDITWAGEAADGKSAIEQILTIHPDLILMDITMPELNGIEATRRILKNEPHSKVVMITMLDDDVSLFAAMQAGARGYVLKGSNAEEMLSVLRAVAHGQVLFGPSMAERVLRFFQGTGQAAAEVFPDLTERERELLTLIAQGKTNSEIAQDLVISPKTVRNHITSIFDKLQVTERSQAIVKARQAGLGR